MRATGAWSLNFFYGWYVLVAAFLVYTLGHGVQFSFGIFLKPLTEEFQWSRSLTAGAFMIYMTCRGVSTIVMGGLTDKYGPRPIVALGGFLMGLGMILGAVMANIWELYFFYGVMAGVGMGVVTVPLSATVSRWFIARRGLTQGLLVSGAGLGSLVISPVAGYLVLGFGISTAYLLMGFGVLVMIILLAFVLRKEPSDMGLSPYGAQMESLPGGQGLRRDTLKEEGLEWGVSRALRSSSFWLLATIAFFFGICLYMTTTNIVAYATDQGVSNATAPSILSIVGGSNIAGIFVMSLVTEKIEAHRVLVLCLAIQAVALFLLIRASSLATFSITSALFGFSYGGVVLALLVIPPEFFGLRYLGSIMGLVFFIHLLGGAVGSEVGNLIYDLSGYHSYRPAFFVVGCVAAAAMVLACIMKKPRRL